MARHAVRPDAAHVIPRLRQLYGPVADTHVPSARGPDPRSHDAYGQHFLAHLLLHSLLLVVLLHRLLLHLLLCLFLGRRNIDNLGFLRRILLGLEEFYFTVIEIIFFVFLIIIIGLGNAIVASILGEIVLNLRVRSAIAALFIISSLVLLLFIEG